MDRFSYVKIAQKPPQYGIWNRNSLPYGECVPTYKLVLNCLLKYWLLPVMDLFFKKVFKYLNWIYNFTWSTKNNCAIILNFGIDTSHQVFNFILFSTKCYTSKLPLTHSNYFQRDIIIINHIFPSLVFILGYQFSFSPSVPRNFSKLA